MYQVTQMSVFIIPCRLLGLCWASSRCDRLMWSLPTLKGLCSVHLLVTNCVCHSMLSSRGVNQLPALAEGSALRAARADWNSQVFSGKSKSYAHRGSREQTLMVLQGVKGFFVLLATLPQTEDERKMHFTKYPITSLGIGLLTVKSCSGGMSGK